jgi:hypothetical protein
LLTLHVIQPTAFTPLEAPLQPHVSKTTGTFLTDLTHRSVLERIDSAEIQIGTSSSIEGCWFCIVTDVAAIANVALVSHHRSPACLSMWG